MSTSGKLRPIVVREEELLKVAFLSPSIVMGVTDWEVRPTVAMLPARLGPPWKAVLQLRRTAALIESLVSAQSQLNQKLVHRLLVSRFG